jgi:hypothetical protein
MNTYIIFLLIIFFTVLFIILGAFVFFKNYLNSTYGTKNFTMNVNIDEYEKADFFLKIKKGNIRIDWGDGTFGAYRNDTEDYIQINHKYDKNDNYVITGYGASIDGLDRFGPEQGGVDVPGYITSVNFLDFNSLKELSLCLEDLTELNVLNLPNLEKLLFSNNAEISEIDLSNSSKLLYLDCSTTAINILNLQPVPNLTELTCYLTSINSLTLSDVPNLIKLNCGDNSNITSLDLQPVPNLTELNCGNTSINNLTLSDVPNLIKLNCGATTITSLDLHSVPNLTELNCNNASIDAEGLNLSDAPNLTSLNCGGNIGINYLDLNSVSNTLEELNCSGTSINPLILPSSNIIKSLTCGDLGLDQTNVDAIFENLVANGIENGYANAISGNSNPGIQGEANIGILVELRGWIVDYVL